MFAQNAIGFWSASASASYPACIDDGHHWWYDPTDLTQVTKNGSNLVSVWAAKGGAKTGKDLLQATETKQPLWVTPGTIRFDGIDNFLKSAAFTWNQPEFIYIIFKQITWTSGDYIFDGNTGAVGGFIQNPSTSKLRIYAGAAFDSGNIALNTWVIARVLFSGVNSKMIFDNAAPITGNAGTSNMGGFTLGARGAETAGKLWYGNIEVKDIVCCDTTDAANETEIYNWLVTRKP